MGMGAPAEFGAFTGAVLNTITKSGGNNYSGIFNMIYPTKSLGSKNISSAISTANPALGDPASTRNLTDFTTQLGGPLIKDKLFFFLSAERFHQATKPSGPVTRRDEATPRLDGKLTWHPGPTHPFTALAHFYSYTLIAPPAPAAPIPPA